MHSIDADDLEVCTVTRTTSGAWPFCEGERCHFVLSRAAYEADLCACLRTDEAALSQLRLDLPRCELSVDGERVREAAQARDVPRSLWRFCTQCVMGIPLCALHDTLLGAVVAERARRSPMLLDVWADGYLAVTKKLRVVFDAETELGVRVELRVNTDDPWISVDFEFEAGRRPFSA